MTAAFALDHDRALDLAAAGPAFPLTPAETRDLGEHLRACTTCARRAARMRADLAAVGRVDPAVSPRLHDRLREVAVTRPRTGPSAAGIVLVLVLLAVAAVGAAAGVGALQGTRPAAPSTSAPAVAPVVDWQTDTVRLTAGAFWIEGGSQRFDASDPSLRVSSDPGDPSRWTLELAWTEHAQEQRLSLYFAADSTHWWINEVRTYDVVAAGGAAGRWVMYPGGPWARTPLGAAFAGDLDLVGDGAAGPVRVHLGGVRIAVNPHDPATRIRLPLPGSPANPSLADLACSGILQLAPVAADTRLRAMGWAVDWRWQHATGPNTGESELRSVPPETGWISTIVPNGDGSLMVVVEDPSNPSLPAITPPPACP